MNFVIIAEWDANNIVTAEARAETEQDAQSKLAEIISEGHVNAFYTALPAKPNHKYWVVDPIAKTITYDQGQADADALPPTNSEIYDQVVQNQAVIKAVVLAFINGELTVGQTGAQAKAAIIARM